MEEHSNNKMKHISLKLLFNHKLSEYNIFYTNKSQNLNSHAFLYDNFKQEALITIKKRIESIKFLGLSSLIEFCKAERLFNMQLVLEWVNYFIYKEEKRQFQFSDSNRLLGITELIEQKKEDKDETCISNGFKFYQSERRAYLTKLLLQLVSTTELFQNNNNDFDNFINKFILNIFLLNFEEASKILKDILNRKISNEIMSFLLIFQEVVLHFSYSPNSAFYNLNESMKGVIAAFVNIDLSSNLNYILYFIQQKFSNKIDDFINDPKVQILIKIIFLLKHYNKEDLFLYLEKLEDFYVERGLLEGLILTGQTQKSIRLIQNYLNSSDDLLVCMILSKFFVDSKEEFSIKCESELFEILNRMKMFNERIILSQKLNEIKYHLEKGYKINLSSSPGDKKLIPLTHNYTMVELIINCFYCNAKIHIDKADQFRNFMINNKEGNEYIDFCPKCLKKLPNCAICLKPIEVSMPVHRGKAVSMDKRDKENLEEVKLELKYMWCTKCRHGGHLEHIKEWFTDLMICPVADCSCVCLEYNHILI